MATNTAEPEAAETTSDGPLLDLTDAGVKKFISLSMARVSSICSEVTSSLGRTLLSSSIVT